MPTQSNPHIRAADLICSEAVEIIGRDSLLAGSRLPALRWISANRLIDSNCHGLRQLDGDYFGDAAFLHGDPVQGRSCLHGFHVVGDENELSPH